MWVQISYEYKVEGAITNTSPQAQHLYMPPNPIIGTYLNLVECLRCKVRADLGGGGGEVGQFQENLGWFQAKVGLHFGKCWDVVKGGFFVCFYQTLFGVLSMQCYKG